MKTVASVLALVTLAAVVASVAAQDRAATRQPPPPIRTTMDNLHAHGGVPPGWKFLLPPGDVAAGRQVFIAMECFACHEVKGEPMPRESKTPRGTGPALTGMGPHHPAEYFAESIINPNRVIIQGPGYTGPDGLSKMPSYADSMTLQQLVDVVAYLRSLGAGGTESGAHHDMGGMTHDMGGMKHDMGGMNPDGAPKKK